jgi:hypothetical protein
MIYFLLVLCFFSLAWSAFVSFVTFKTLKSNFELQDKMKVHYDFFDEILSVIVQDSVFLRSSLVKKLSLDIPEVKELNSSIISFENRLSQVKLAIDSYKKSEAN